MMEEKKTFYVTTPIYYPSGDLHIGHTYTTVAADTLTRFKKLTGYDAYFLTGTDEHGQKIQKAAEEKGVTPQAYVDDVVGRIKELWKLMNINYDQFIRTTDPEHEKTIQQIFKKLYDQGDIYKGKYEGWYCTPCESFWTESQLVDGNCPDCGRPVEKASEEAYFFKMSKYADRLLKYIEDHPDFIQPESRKNEMINNFIKPGLQDLCVSRTSFSWGVPVTFDPGHVVYVWIDALPNYISALGYLNDKPQLMDKYWPANVHLVGKDIIRFHTIYWPIILMALDLPLPEHVYGHGWILLKGGKMSKSVGNVVDPVELAEKYGVDALRYHMLREMTYGADGIYNEDLLVSHINSDLANDLGNLLSRTVAMTVKYFDGVIPAERESGDFDAELIALAEETPGVVEDYMNKLDFSRALEAVWKLVSRTNKYIDETQPWVLIKDPEKKARLAMVMYNLTESLRIISVLVSSAMPDTGVKIADELKVPEELRTWESIQSFGKYPDGIQVERCEPIFPRIEVKKEKQEQKQPPKKEKQTKKEEKAEVPEGLITIDDFAKVEMKVAEVISCEQHPDADRLLVFQLDLGTEKRQIISGIAKYYKPEDLVGKKVIVCTNLKPVMLRGLESNGMILSAVKGKKLSILTVDGDVIPAGGKVS
ncbi:methionine--tRNA ligase [Eubacterium callanderi]|uniref:methionine--tRNA ligase n=1 Tax=Eubacterium callanderi TaxID=53442 RepID=UPI001AA139AC|nr:methionine--tRNA ligase [Eubacterium callanderi]MBO1702012.1 methionine--tRNA ligase [Eubacterium callanderi]